MAANKAIFFILFVVCCLFEIVSLFDDAKMHRRNTQDKFRAPVNPQFAIG
jgi:hypothetical protein